MVVSMWIMMVVMSRVESRTKSTIMMVRSSGSECVVSTKAMVSYFGKLVVASSGSVQEFW